MLRSDDYISFGFGHFVWTPNWDYPDQHFNADELKSYVTHNLARLSLSDCEFADEMIAKLKRLDSQLHVGSVR